MKLRYTDGDGGVLWIDNLATSGQLWLAKPTVRIPLVGGILFLLVGTIASKPGTMSGFTDPLIVGALLLAMLLYFRKPKFVNPLWPKRLGFSAEAFEAELVSGQVIKHPWSEITAASFEPKGAKPNPLTLTTRGGPVEIQWLNWNLAYKVLWAHRLASRGKLDPQELRDAPPPASQTGPTEEGGARVTSGTNGLRLFPDHITVHEGERWVAYPAADIDLVKATMMESELALVVARGCNVSIVSDDAEIAIVRRWYADLTGPSRAGMLTASEAG